MQKVKVKHVSFACPHSPAQQAEAWHGNVRVMALAFESSSKAKTPSLTSALGSHI